MEEGSTNGRARYLLDGLVKAGWLKREDPMDFSDTDILIPTYARKFLNAMTEIQEDMAALRRYTSSIYANLKTACNDRSAMYDLFTNAQSYTVTLIEVLSTMSADIGTAYDELLQRISALEIFQDFENYTEKITEKYHSLKTDENVFRYKHQIIEILSKWEYDNEVLTLMAKQKIARQMQHEDEAKADILNAIGEMRDAFDRIDRFVNMIDKKNSRYMRTTAEKVNYSLNQNRDFKDNLVQVIKAVAESPARDKCLELLSRKIPLYSVALLNPKSTYKPNKKHQTTYTPLPLSGRQEQRLEEVKKSITEQYRQKANSIFSEANVLKFMAERFAGGQEFSTLGSMLRDDLEFVKLILAYKLAIKRKAPFRVKLLGDEIRIGRYIVPNMTFYKEG
jgi:hypothetical protein